MSIDKIIVCGPPLAWKSTLSRMLAEQLWLSHIPVDWFVTAFQHAFQELGIQHDSVVSLDTWKSVASRLYPFLCNFIKELDEQASYWWYVIEWFHIDVEQIVRDFRHSHTLVVVWYPQISWEEKFTLTRKYDSDNWTNDCNDQELQQLIWLFIELSTYFSRVASDNALDCIDTSIERNTALQVWIDSYKQQISSAV